MINIVVPLAGEGKRFKDGGFNTPKPFILVNKKTLIEHAVNTIGIDGKFIFITRKYNDEKYNKKITEILKSLKPDCVEIKVDKKQRGAADAILYAKDLINNKNELITINCDQIMNWDHEAFNLFCKNYPHDGFLVTYYANTEKNSYVKIKSNGFAQELKEKQIISNISTNGIHFWKKGSDFVQSVKRMIEKNDRAPNGEFYIAPSYNYLIEDNKKIGIYHIPNCQHWAVGTEEDLKEYLKANNND